MGGEGDWPKVDTAQLPVGSLSVPVLVDDNGFEYQTQMLAGQFGFDVVGDGKVVQPRSDWCIAMPKKTEAYCYSQGGAEETVPLLQQEEHTEDAFEDDESNDLQCLLFPELQHPVSP